MDDSSRPEQPRSPSSRAVLVICTRNRTADLARALTAVRGTGYAGHVLIVDASDPEQLAKNARLSAQAHAEHLRAPRVGLARQRNDALNLLHGRYDIVHFIDDDTVVHDGYFAAIEKRFEENPRIAGLGAVVSNQQPVRWTRVKALFGLYSRVPGRVLRSGRNTIGHFPGPRKSLRKVEWLPGCCMSYRLTAISGMQFDERLRGYSWGEDFDFSFRVSRRFEIAIEPRATCTHNESPVNRMQLRELAAERTVILHRWVSENTVHGMSVQKFWISVVGEFLLRSVDLASPESREVARGVLQGARRVISRG